MIHTSIDFPDDLGESTKMLGGHGIIRSLCIGTLEEFVLHTSDPEVLPIAARQRIQATRERIELARNEERIIHDCWEELVKARMSPIIARYGIKKRTLEPIIEEAKMWIFEKYGRLPTDDEIATRFKEYYGSELLYWSTERAKAFRTAIMKDVAEPPVPYRASGENHV